MEYDIGVIMSKKYEKPEIKIHGDIKSITNGPHPKGRDGSDVQGGIPIS